MDRNGAADGDTHSVKVTETVTGELTENRNHEDLGHTPPPVTGQEERAIYPISMRQRTGLQLEETSLSSTYSPTSAYQSRPA